MLGLLAFCVAVPDYLVACLQLVQQDRCPFASAATGAVLPAVGASGSARLLQRSGSFCSPPS